MKEHCNIGVVYLTQNKVAIVDIKEMNQINKTKWVAMKTKSGFYAVYSKYLGKIEGKEKRKAILMHRLITNAPKGFDVDHINGNGLDNRKSNLRVVSHRQNLQNQTKRNSSSKYPGVYWYKPHKKWRAVIGLNGKRKDLGEFDDEREAAKIYEKACREFFGEELICKT